MERGFKLPSLSYVFFLLMQTCRWKVTSKDTLLQICEYSEAGVTIRGQYFPPGKQPGEDERKLYLAIEGLYCAF